MRLFQYAPDLLADHTTICGGVLHASSLQNGPTPEALLDSYTDEQAAVRARLPESLSELPSLAAWRAAFRRFGANPTKYRSAAEALMRRLQKKGDIPSINCLVDIGNLVSIRYALPVAIFDWRDVSGTVTVHPAAGHERFRELGSDEVAHPPPGEVIFSDETGMVLARRWCWRQSQESESRADTSTAIVTVEAQHAGSLPDVEQALSDLSELLATYAGGQIQGAILDAQHPVFDLEQT
ncbi:MAG: B3/4 domain-containing protein [Caldilineaceae bacterium]|jgi:DNA/RNA-binding domain of Phe-tRNA-synthetase-like protein